MSSNKRQSKIIVVIPARGGSKAIPKKNIRFLNGKPLIYYAIKTALESKYTTEVVVSSDDEVIGEITKLYGATFIKRPRELAEDDVPLDPVIYHAVESREKTNKKRFDLIVTLQPTSPLLKVSTLDKAIKYMLEHPEYDSLIAVKNATHLYWVETENGVEPFFKERKNRQYLPKVWQETGAIFISRRDIITPQSRLGRNIYLFEIPKDEAVDIDEYPDWWIAEMTMKKKRIVFRVDGGKNIGLGHVYRALTLADKLSIGNDVFFVFNKKRNWGIELVKDRFYTVFEFESAKEFWKILEQIKPHIVINDILDTRGDYMLKLQQKTDFIVNFEDLGEGASYADLVFNALYEFASPPSNHFYGYKYVCLREEFLIYPFKKVSPEVKKILVTFGGTDPNNLTFKVLKALSEIDINNAQITILLGLGYSSERKENLKKLISQMRDNGKSVTVKENVALVAKEIYESDIVVTSNGRTIYEVASIGVPTISISQNEREARHLFTHISGGVLYLGMANSVSEHKIKEAIMRLMSDYELRKRLNQNFSKFNLRKGIDRVLRIIMEKYEEKKEAEYR